MLTLVTLLTMFAPNLTALEASRDRHLVESLELDGMGRSGTLKTRPLHLEGSPGTFAFGSGPCAKYKLGEHVLAALQDALHRKQPIAVKSVAAGDTLCLAGITFFAPMP